MSTQIAVRLPDELVAFIDEHVRRGQDSSRAAFVARAVERQRRQETAERDAAILAAEGADKDFDGLADYAAQTPMDDLA